MTIENAIFLLCAICYLYNNGPNQIFLDFLTKFYFRCQDFLIEFNKIIHPDYWELFPDISDIISDKSDNDSHNKQPKIIIKYEDKYLENVRQLRNTWDFSEDEINEKNKKTHELLNEYTENIQSRIEEINNNILELEKEIREDADEVKFIESFDTNGDDLIEEVSLQERNDYRNEQIREYTEELNKLKQQIVTEEGLNQLKIQAGNEATHFIVGKKIKNLNNCYVMEKTPQGNVLMIYDKDRESFKYYSDSNIPYRYLEVVGRKYVKSFHCRPLFVDMEEELKLVDEKWTKEYELKKAKEIEEKMKQEENIKNNKPLEKKKNVFAKFKSYNKDSGGKMSMAPPPKNSIPSKSLIETKENEKILLKEKANRYTYEGKFANFRFLQKIERKVFNKKLAISFADFKKMQKNNQ
jgi:hypothetical protein